MKDKLKNLIEKIGFWIKYWTDKDFRYQVRYEEWSALHSCVECGCQDWAGHTLVFDPMGSGMLCRSCMRALDEQEMNDGEYED